MAGQAYSAELGSDKGVASLVPTTYTHAVVKLFLVFTIVPLCEIYLLLMFNQYIGFWPTVGLVLGTGAAGAVVAHAEGLRVLRQWQRSLVRGRVPEEGVLGGLLVLVGGVLLVAPGVITDLAGILLLIPPTRRLVARAIRTRLERKIHDGSIKVVSVSHVEGQSQSPAGYDSFRPPRVVMDVEAEEIDLDDDDSSRASDRRVLH